MVGSALAVLVELDLDGGPDRVADLSQGNTWLNDGGFQLFKRLPGFRLRKLFDVDLEVHTVQDWWISRYSAILQIHALSVIRNTL